MTNKSTLKNILPQLQSWCAVNNISVQSVYDACHGMTLQELVYYLLGVVKQSSEEVIDYEGQFTQLYDYVNNYFKNLDISDEIKNELENMSESGELGTLIQSISKTNWLNGKKICVYGDSTASITASPWTWISENIQNVTITNRSIGGTNLTATGTSPNNSGVTLITNASDLSNFDVVVVQYGVNDFMSSVELDGESSSQVCLRPALQSIIQHIQSSGAECLVILPFYSMIFPDNKNKNNRGSELINYIDVMIDTCLSLNCLYIDMYHLTGCNKNNYTQLLQDTNAPIYNHQNTVLRDRMISNILNKTLGDYTPQHTAPLPCLGNIERSSSIQSPNITFLTNIDSTYVFGGKVFNSSRNKIRITGYLIGTNCTFAIGSTTIASITTPGYFCFYITDVAEGRLNVTGTFDSISMQIEVLANNVGFEQRRLTISELNEHVSCSANFIETFDKLICRDFLMTTNAQINSNTLLFSLDIATVSQSFVVVTNQTGNAYRLLLNSTGLRTVDTLPAGTYCCQFVKFYGI